MNLNIEISKDGYRILKIAKDEKTRLLGSKYNHKREINKFIDKLGRNIIEDNYIIFGLSFGEHIEELLKRISSNSIISIIELSGEIIEYCRNDKYINNILKDHRVIIISNKDDVNAFFESVVTEDNIDNLKIGCYCNYDKIFNNELKIINEAIKNNFVKLTTNRNTRLHYAELWFDLLFKNIKYMQSGISANRMKSKFRDIPAIIVSAGPSLNKNIHKLKEISNGLIFTGGRTLGALVDMEIEPDFVCAVDPLKESYELVEKYISEVKCPLVFYEGTNSDIVEKHRGHKIFSTNSEFIRESFKEDIISLSGGGSVAHSMTLLALYMGCNPIIFIGQDLAYTDDKVHAECAENTWGKNELENYKKNDDLYVEDINGNLVRTSIELNGFKVALENIIGEFPQIQFINATEGGVNIRGTKNINLENIEVIKGQYDKDIKFDISNDYIYEYKKNLTKVSDKFEEYMRIYECRKDIYSKYKKISLLEDKNEIIKKIKDIDHDLTVLIDDIKLIKDIVFKFKYELNRKKDLVIYMDDSQEEILKKRLKRNEFLFESISKFITKNNLINLKFC